MNKQSVIALIIGCLLGCGCRTSQPATDSTSSGDHVNPERFNEILNRLNAGPGSGIQAGTVAYASATNYIVSRFQAARLQPGLRSGFDATFRSEINTVKSISVEVAGRDSVRLAPGVDYVADARTGTNAVAFESFATGPLGQMRAGMADVALLAVEQGSTRNLRLLDEMGYEAAVLVGPLGHKSQSSALDSMSVVRITSGGFGRLMRLSPSGVSSILNANTPRVFALPTRVQVQTNAIRQTGALRSNLISMLPGRHPSMSSKLVVVAAQLDSGTPGGVGYFDFHDLGIGAAVVVDIATALSEEIAFSSTPTPSFMFVLTGGSPQTLEGFKSFLSNSIWDRKDILEVMVIGFDEALEPAVLAEGKRYGVSIELIPLSVPSNFRRSGFVARQSDLVRASNRAGEAVRFENRERRAAMTAAGLEAQRLSDIIKERIQNLLEGQPANY